MKVEVTAVKFGNHKKGETIEMNISTAKALESHGIVKLVGKEPKKKTVKKGKAGDLSSKSGKSQKKSK